MDKCLYVSPWPSTWANCLELIAALGCTLVRKTPELDGIFRGECPREAQLHADGAIYYPKRLRLDAQAWAHIAHEAVHHVAGSWSFDDESDMLPFELGLLRRIATADQRLACLRFMATTSLGDDLEVQVADLVTQHGAGWAACDEWRALEAGALARGLTIDGTIPRAVSLPTLPGLASPGWLG